MATIALAGTISVVSYLSGTLNYKRLAGAIAATSALRATLDYKRLAGTIEATTTLSAEELLICGNITCGHTTGKTLKAKVYAQDGTRRENPDISLTEIPTGTGLYVGLATSMLMGDLVLIYDNATGDKLYFGEYIPKANVKDSETVIINNMGGAGNSGYVLNKYP